MDWLHEDRIPDFEPPKDKVAPLKPVQATRPKPHMKRTPASVANVKMSDLANPDESDIIEAPHRDNSSANNSSVNNSSANPEGTMTSKRAPADSPLWGALTSKRLQPAQQYDLGGIEVEEESVISNDLLPSVDGQVSTFTFDGCRALAYGFIRLVNSV